MPSACRRGKTPHMIDLLRFISGLAADLVRRHGELIAENALLRQQLIVAHRKVAGRVRWASWQRFTMLLPRASRRLGVRQPCSSSRRLSSAGIGPDSAPSGGGALGR